MEIYTIYTEVESLNRYTTINEMEVDFLSAQHKMQDVIDYNREHYACEFHVYVAIKIDNEPIINIDSEKFLNALTLEEIVRA